MKVTRVETVLVGAGWKNWCFVRIHTDRGLSGLGEATLNGFAAATSAAVEEISHAVVGEDPRRISAIVQRLTEGFGNDGGHIHRTAIAGIETACWDVLGQDLGVPVHELWGGAVRERVPAYANGWYRAERTPEAFAACARDVTARGFTALKLDPFGAARGLMAGPDLARSVEIVAAVRDAVGGSTEIFIDAHARFAVAQALQVAREFAGLGVAWLEEPTSRDRIAPSLAVARSSPIPVATGETLHTTAGFLDLAVDGSVSVFQPEPMSLGGLARTLDVAAIARAAPAWIAPHQSGGPVATVMCLQLAAAIPNFLVQEHFDPFNEPWTRELVSWAPQLDPADGTLPIPTAPGLGVQLVDAVAAEHPYEPAAYLDIYAEGWERRLGQAVDGRDP